MASRMADHKAGQGEAELVGRPAGGVEEPVRPVVRPRRRQAGAEKHPAHRASPGRGEHPDHQRAEHPERRRRETRPETVQQHGQRNRYRDVREHRRPLFRVGSGSADAPSTSPVSWPYVSPPRRVVPPLDTAGICNPSSIRSIGDILPTSSIDQGKPRKSSTQDTQGGLLTTATRKGPNIHCGVIR
jgi:hypothetical protein